MPSLQRRAATVAMRARRGAWDTALATALPSNNSSVAAIVVERAGAPVLLLCFNNCGAGRFPLSVAASYDAGVAFVCVRDISGRELVGGGNRFATSQCSCSEQRRGEHSYPSVALDPAEPIVHVSWTHLRKTIAYAHCRNNWRMAASGAADRNNSSAVSHAPFTAKGARCAR
jgi:predicted neuraminidase